MKIIILVKLKICNLMHLKLATNFSKELKIELCIRKTLLKTQEVELQQPFSSLLPLTGVASA